LICTKQTTAFFHYREIVSKLIELSKSPGSSASWFLVEVPSGFDVIDVVLVEASNSPAIYGFQISRSGRPFTKHHTLDTCLPKSKERLSNLWRIICDTFQLVAVQK
jgi:hypothetical protein